MLGPSAASSADGSNKLVYCSALLPSTGGLTGKAAIIGGILLQVSHCCFFGAGFEACTLALLDEGAGTTGSSLSSDLECWHFSQ